MSGFSRTIGAVIQDLRFALRMLTKERWFTAVAVVSLALGIGANTAIFSLINTLMLRQLPVREPQQLVQFLSAYPGDPRMNVFPWTSYERFRDRNTVVFRRGGLGTGTFCRESRRIGGADRLTAST